MSLAADLWRALRTRKSLWLPAIFLVLLLLAMLSMLADESGIAPIVYTLL